jgi:Cytochrome C oxidase, cbb3-type, subunit III
MSLGFLPTQSVGAVLAAIAVVTVVVYAAINLLFSGKKELGSELELAANRKPYLSDEELEGPKLDRTLTFALITLFVIAVALPLYWILEPGRQAGAKDDFNRKFVKEGGELFAPVGDNLHALGCAGCHGGMKATGGSATYNITEPDGSIKVVNWKAPALNTVLQRFSRDEVTFILTYGRPFSPMPAWGVEGGGPLDAQQVQNLVDYLESIQISSDESQKAATDELAKMMALKDASGQPVFKSEGEALFNMGITDGFAGGAYSCGRCHTQGWSYAESYDDIRAVSGCGALGPSLCGDSEDRQFPALATPDVCPVNPDGSVNTSVSVTTTTAAGATSSGSGGGEVSCTSPYKDQVDFVTDGSDLGKKYGIHGQGSGKMPGFGLRPAEKGLFWINQGKEREAGPGMLPEDLIDQIVEYERGL